MKRFSTLLLLVACAVMAQAQKLDTQLMLLVGQSGTRGEQVVTNQKVLQDKLCANLNADGTIQSVPVIGYLQRGAECPVGVLKAKGIEVKRVVDNMVSMVVPLGQLTAFEAIDEFILIIPMTKADIYNKEAAASSKASVVNTAASATAAGLPRNYTGKGVVLGIIDQGIDYNHGAFRNADGSTRVVKAFMMKDDKGNYDYVTSEGVTGFITDNMTTSHGTHTAATAAGTELGNGQQGVAPEVDIVLCGLDTYSSTTNIAGFIKEIFKYADEVSKPAVVSISMGSILFLHDGSDFIAETVREETQNGTKPGRVVLISSSNSAANWQTIVKSGTTKSVMGSATEVTATAPAVYNCFYTFYASDYQDFTIALKVVDITTGEVMPIGNHVLHQKSGAVMENFDLIKDSDCETATPDKKAVVYYLNLMETAVKLDAPKYRLAVVATSQDGQNLKLICNGDNNAEPCFDAPTVSGGYDFAANGWTKGNGDIAFNSNICNDAVISVGSYITRTGWKTWEGNDRGYPESTFTGKVQQIGEISDFSSWGTDDNQQLRLLDFHSGCQ